MTDRTARFIRNVRFVMHGLSVEELYQVSLALRDEAARRNLDCGPEAKALTCALLVPARQEHRAIYSADCSPRDDDERRPWNPPAARPWRDCEHDRAGIEAALRELDSAGG